MLGDIQLVTKLALRVRTVVNAVAVGVDALSKIVRGGVGEEKKFSYA